MTRDAKNSLFAATFVFAFFGALYVASQLENKASQIAVPLITTIMFGFAKRYVMASDEHAKPND